MTETAKPPRPPSPRFEAPRRRERIGTSISRFSRYLVGALSVIGSVLVSAPAHADEARSPTRGSDSPSGTLPTPAPPATPCTFCSTEADRFALPTWWLEPGWRGVALQDLPLDVGFDGAALTAAIASANPMRLTRFLSLSLVSADGPTLTLLAVGRAPRFADASTASDRKILGADALGVVTLRVTPPLDRSALADELAVEVLSEHALADLAPRLEVSLRDRTLVLDLPGLHLRRVYPVGVGALDAVRNAPAITSLTPITDRARVSRKGSLLSLRGSSWARDLPYIPFEVPWVSTSPAPMTRERLYYSETRVAFHAWPGRNFMRGFNSHGCVTLRDGDLLELAAFVFGAARPLPLSVVVDAPDARHPLPHEDGLFWRLVNTGTEARPAFQLRGNLYYLERLREQIPDLTSFTGRYMDGERQAWEKGRLSRAADAGIPDALLP